MMESIRCHFVLGPPPFEGIIGPILWHFGEQNEWDGRTPSRGGGEGLLMDRFWGGKRKEWTGREEEEGIGRRRGGWCWWTFQFRRWMNWNWDEWMNGRGREVCCWWGRLGRVRNGRLSGFKISIFSSFFEIIYTSWPLLRLLGKSCAETFCILFRIENLEKIKIPDSQTDPFQISVAEKKRHRWWNGLNLVDEIEEVHHVSKFPTMIINNEFPPPLPKKENWFFLFILFNLFVYQSAGHHFKCKLWLFLIYKLSLPFKW